MLMFNRVFAAIAALVMATLLAGCGGGGGAGAQGSSGGGGVSGAAALDLKTSTPSVGSDGRTVALITAFVKDSSNRALANQTVDFSTTDNGSMVRIITARTDASGVATASLQVNDPTNRSVPVTAVTGSLSRTVSVAVVGTTLTISGPSSLIANAPTDFTVGLRDSSGTVLTGKTVTVTSSRGNALSAASVVTNSAGQAQFSLTGTQAGTDTIVVSALGSSATAAVQVASAQVVFSAPSANQEVVVAALQPVSVTYMINGVPQVGTTIQFSATRGALSAPSAVTDGTGRASVSVSSATAGVSTITALVGSLVSSQRVEFVSRTPAKLTLQASPANVNVNPAGTSANSSQLIAVVRDAADNPVKGQTVAFTQVIDPSNGEISPAVATTDSSGVATVAFYPGPNSTGTNQIVMRGEIPGAGVSGTATLTATGQEVSVRVGTGNTIESPSLSSYAMPWTVVVSNASGNPVENASVQVSLVATRYGKGYYYAVATGWVQVVTQRCISEDVNGNGDLDAGEDTNGDRALTPSNVAVASVLGSGRTDANGTASLSVVYPKDYANWVDMRLRVTMKTLAGTEGAAERVFTLAGAAADYSNPLVNPPGNPSPFGRQSGCENTD